MKFDILTLNLTLSFILVLFGLTGNVIIFLVFRRSKFNKTLPRNYFCLLAFTEAISLISVVPYHLTVTGISIYTWNVYYCKILSFIGYFFPAVSSWLLVIINIERFISVNYKSIIIFGQISFQTTVVGALFMVNFIIYFTLVHGINLVNAKGFLINDDNLVSNLTNKTTVYCAQRYNQPVLLISWLNIVNKFFLPLAFMLICSIGIIHSIYVTHKKMMNDFMSRNLKRLKKNIFYSMAIISLSVAFLVFNLPIIFHFLSLYFLNSVAILFLDLVFYAQYIFNIFVYFILNAKFRRELLMMFGLRPKIQRNKCRKIKKVNCNISKL